VPSDDVAANNLRTIPTELTANVYSYKYPGTTASGGVGVNGFPAELLAKFSFTSATQIDSVLLEFPFAPAGSLFRISIRGESAGLPGTQIYVDASDRTPGTGALSFRLPAPVSVPAGNVYVGVMQTNTINMGLGFDAEAPIRAGAFYVSVSGGAFADFAPGSNFKLNIGVIVGACLVPMSVDASPVSATACAGGGNAFSATATGGTGARTYQWTENGVNIGGATNAVLNISKASAGSFNYNVRVTDDGGCVDYVDGTNSVGTWIADGASCNDANNCTGGDVCGSGTCNGSPISAPPETSGVLYAPDLVTLSWAVPVFATNYDVVRGSTTFLPTGPGGIDEVCFPNTGGPSIADGALPPPGTAYWYLVRAKNSCGIGSYGTDSSLNPRLTTTCP